MCPEFDSVKAFRIGDVENQNCSLRILVVDAEQRSVFLLASSVPHVDVGLFALLQGALVSVKAHAEGTGQLFFEEAFDKNLNDAAFANAWLG